MCRDAGIGSVSVGSCCTLWLAAHVAPEEAVLSSPRNRCGRRKLRNLLRPWGPWRAPTTYPPGTEALGPPLPSPCTPPTPQGILQKKSF